jgi:hypothetical protein
MAIDSWFTDISPSPPSPTLDLLASPYTLLDDVEAFGWVYRRTWVKSPYVEGQFLANAVRDICTQNIRVMMGASDHTQLEDEIIRLINCVSQSGYEWHIVLDATERAWICWPADIKIVYDKPMLDDHIAIATLTMYHQPYAVGAFNQL